MDYNITAEELKIFLDEAEEQIQLLTEGLLALEKNSDNALLQDIFRAAHTIKGGAATLGRVRMTRLAHALETALNRLRNGELQPEPRLIDLMLQATDGLNALCRELAGEKTGDLELDPLRVTLENFVPSEAQVLEQTVSEETPVNPAPQLKLLPLSNDETSEAQSALANGVKLYIIDAKLIPDTFLPAARLLQLYFALLSLGRILKSSPTIEEIEQEQPGAEISLLFATTSPEAETKAVLMAANELASWQFEPFALSTLTASLVLATPSELASVSTEAVQPSPPLHPLQPATSLAQPTGASVSLPDAVPVLSSGEEVQDAELDVKATATAAANPTDGKTIRVNVAQLDKLMNLIGELVVYRTSLSHVAGKLEQRGHEPELATQLNETLNYLSRITDDLQDNVLKTRMTPIEKLFRRMPRLVRDLARQMGKEVEFVLEGEQTELDRSIIEEISDPLIHLLRNAVDHGLEWPEAREETGKSRVGQIKLSAAHRDGAVFIEVEDNGRGMSADKVRQRAIDKGLIASDVATRLTREECLDLIFLPGFSTAATVTEVSGRGVGMDIVRTNITRVGGSVSLETLEGQGSRFILRLPLTLAIIRALLVTARGSRYAIPLGSITETLRVSSADIQTVEGVPLVRLRDKFLPLIALERALGFAPDSRIDPVTTTNAQNQPGLVDQAQDTARQLMPQEQKFFSVVAVRFERFQVGLVVERFLGEEEVVIKPLGWYLGEVPGLTGAMIEGDGRVALIIDVPNLLRATLRGDHNQLRASLSRL